MKMTAVARWVLALVLAVAAGLKLAWMAGHKQAAGAETLFSGLPMWGKWGLVAAELGLAAWLANGWLQRWAAMAAICLLSVFLCVVVIEMGKVEPKSCGCLGAMAVGSGRTSLWVTLGMDVGLLGLALWVYFAALRRRA